ncbi:MAG: hypothetical protein RLZZ395_354, partial [Pseudomonadota bacterium]
MKTLNELMSAGKDAAICLSAA